MASVTLDAAIATIPKDQKLFYKDIANVAKKRLTKYKRTINHIISYLQYRQKYVFGRYDAINFYLTDPINVSEQFNSFNLISKSHFNKSQDLDNITAMLYKIIGQELILQKTYKRENIELDKNTGYLTNLLTQLDTLQTQINTLITKLG